MMMWKFWAELCHPCPGALLTRALFMYHPILFTNSSNVNYRELCAEVPLWARRAQDMKWNEMKWNADRHSILCQPIKGPGCRQHRGIGPWRWRRADNGGCKGWRKFLDTKTEVEVALRFSELKWAESKSIFMHTYSWITIYKPGVGDLSSVCIYYMYI